jgi:hypothetical protein
MRSVFNQNKKISNYFCHPVAHATDLLIKLSNYIAQDDLYVQQLINFRGALCNNSQNALKCEITLKCQVILCKAKALEAYGNIWTIACSTSYRNQICVYLTVFLCYGQTICVLNWYKKRRRYFSTHFLKCVNVCIKTFKCINTFKKFIAVNNLIVKNLDILETLN